MHRIPAVHAALLVILSLAPAPAASGAEAPAAPKRAASREGWPGTHAGRAARGWVEAFSTGEAAMREFLDRGMAPRSLTQRGVAQRVESYRKLRERYGRLEFASIVKSAPDKLTVKLMAADASLHEFIFETQPEPPHKLQSVSIRENAGGLHGMFGGFHH